MKRAPAASAACAQPPGRRHDGVPWQLITGNPSGRAGLGVGERAAVPQLDASPRVVLAGAQYPLPHELMELGWIVGDRAQVRPAGDVLLHVGLLDVAAR